MIHADGVLRDSLKTRLERYIIADDVQVDDITDSFTIFHVVGADPNSIAARRSVVASRFGRPGFDLWIESDKAGQVKAELSNALPLCDEAWR